MGDGHLPRTYQPSVDEITGLIRRAETHPLGTEFLLNGSADAVAATFQVHGFVVDAARDLLRRSAAALGVRVSAAVAGATA
ncbi:MAG: hypothetical protein ACYTJ0_15330 [Planctomycetota bacterium]|jgi:hypothetical protein